MYAVTIGILWVSAGVLAPDGHKITLLRCLCVAFALTFLGNASRHYLTPLIGNWVILICFAICLLIVKGFFRLSLWRSVMVTLIYYASMIALYYLLLMKKSQ